MWNLDLRPKMIILIITVGHDHRRRTLWSGKPAEGKKEEGKKRVLKHEHD
jgi:hypothetical protein